MGSYVGRSQSPPILYGNLVSVVEQLEDLQGNKGLYFLFPDVSIRWRGRYQLGVTLSRISKYAVFLHILIGWLMRFMFSVEPGGTLLTQTRTRAFDAVALHQYRAARVLFSFKIITKMLNCWTMISQSSNAPDAKFPSAGCKNVPQHAIFLSLDVWKNPYMLSLIATNWPTIIFIIKFWKFILFRVFTVMCERILTKN